MLHPTAAYGLESLELPSSSPLILDTADLVEGILSLLIAPLDVNEKSCLCVSLDAEWNISHHIGVSIVQIAPHSCSNDIYIIPVCSFHFLIK